jgi:PDZ and LIM domain protein 5/6/7
MDEHSGSGAVRKGAALLTGDFCFLVFLLRSFGNLFYVSLSFLPTTIMLAASTGSDAGRGRISRLLPSVTCSSCGDAVPLDELADHVCRPPSPNQLPLPSQPSKISLLTQRINDLSRRDTRSSQQTRSSYSTHRSPSPARTERRAPSPASTYRSHSPALTVRSQPSSRGDRSRHERNPSAGSRTAASSPASTPAVPVAVPRALSPAVRPPRSNSSASSASSSYRTRTASINSPSSPPSNPPPVPQLMPRAPSAASSRSRAPSNASGYVPGPAGIMIPPPSRRPSAASVNSSFSGRGPLSVTPPLPGPISPSSPGAAHSIHDERDIDTKSGGEAGMAGVGRRGFAAAARAAMFTTATMNHYTSPYQEQPLSMGGRRPNAPSLLDIGRSSASSISLHIG